MNMPPCPPDLVIGLAYPLLAADQERVLACARQLLPAGRHKLIGLQPTDPLPDECQIYFAEDDPPPGLGTHPSLRWIQACSAGADAFVSLPNVRSGAVQLTTASGIHSVHIAEFVIAAMINLCRRMDQLWSLMNQRRWPVPRGHLAGPPLRGQTVAILGYGSIGREVGRLAHAFGMRVIAINTRAEPHPDTGFHAVPGIGDPEGRLPVAWHTSRDLPNAVRDADFLVITCPLTPATRGIVNAAVLGAMKPTAYIVNVARGAIIDFPALRAALTTKRLAGAALDVFPTEPLPADDPVFDLPNVQLTPHMSGVMTEAEYSRLLAEVYIANLTRFVRGQPLLNLVEVAP